MPGGGTVPSATTFAGSPPRDRPPMRIWFDMTAPAHPVVFRPVIERLLRAGHEVEVTARDYAQTLPLLERMEIPFTAIGRHGGASRVRKLAALAGRTRRMRRHGGRRVDPRAPPRPHRLPPPA